jgi:hypothetical protein
MVRFFRLFNLTLLCVAVMAGSVSMAVARGQALALSHGGTTIVICTGYGVMTLALDGNGKPIGAVHPCPDCLAGLAAYLPPHPAGVTPNIRPGTKVLPSAHDILLRVAIRFHTLARGPPLIG